MSSTLLMVSDLCAATLLLERTEIIQETDTLPAGMVVRAMGQERWQPLLLLNSQ